MTSKSWKELVILLILILLLFFFLFLGFFLFFLSLYVVVKDRCCFSPLKDFRKQDDLENLFHDSLSSPEDEEDPVDKIALA